MDNHSKLLLSKFQEANNLSEDWFEPFSWIESNPNEICFGGGGGRSNSSAKAGSRRARAEMKRDRKITNTTGKKAGISPQISARKTFGGIQKKPNF